MSSDTLDLNEFSTRVFVPEDVTTINGNVVTPAGVYPATPDEVGEDGFARCTIWTDAHYAGCNRVGLPEWSYTRTESDPPPIPEHDCAAFLRSDVTSTVFYCGICREVFA